MAWGPQPHQISNLALVRGGLAGPQLVAILRPGVTSWTVPKASKYTFYVYGPGTTGQGGGFARKTVQLSKGLVLTTSIRIGTSGGGGTTYTSEYQPTTLVGGPINISVLGTDISGGDVSIPGTSSQSGGDGSLFGSIQGAVLFPGLGLAYGISPGGPTQAYSAFSSGAGEIRIVDETP